MLCTVELEDILPGTRLPGILHGVPRHSLRVRRDISCTVLHQPVRNSCQGRRQPCRKVLTCCDLQLGNLSISDGPFGLRPVHLVFGQYCGLHACKQMLPAAAAASSGQSRGRSPALLLTVTCLIDNC